MKLTNKHIDALRYVASGDYARPGMGRSDLDAYVQELRDNGYIEVRCVGDRAKLVLTILGQSIMNSITR